MRHLIFFMLIMYSCQVDSNETKAIENVISIQISDSLKPIVDSLSNSESLDDSSTGYGGSKSLTYSYFEELNNKASDEELINLIDHENSIVNGYAYLALVLRENSATKEICEKHKNDTTMITRMSGCMIYRVKISKFYQSTLKNKGARITAGPILIEE